MAGVVHLPVYATGFRGADVEAALQQLAPISLRYGATKYEVFRSRDDRYKFLLVVDFDSHDDWNAYWFGEEFTDWRAACSSWYTVPLLYVWNDRVAGGGIHEQVAAGGARDE